MLCDRCKYGDLCLMMCGCMLDRLLTGFAMEGEPEINAKISTVNDNIGEMILYDKIDTNTGGGPEESNPRRL